MEKKSNLKVVSFLLAMSLLFTQLFVADTKAFADVEPEQVVEETEFGRLYFEIFDGSAVLVACGVDEAYKNKTFDLVIPDTVKDGEYKVTEIGSYSFFFNENIKSLVIPEGVTVIGERAFTECSKLESVSYPETLTEIQYGAFSDCALKSITIPASVKTIGRQAFIDNKKLTSITLKNDAVAIGNYALGYYDNGNADVVVDGICVGARVVGNVSINGVKKDSKAASYAKKNNITYNYGKKYIMATPRLGFESTSKGVKISWSKVAEASRYVIYKKSGKKWKYVKTTTSTSYVDKKAKKSGAKYQYKVYANNKKGTQSKCTKITATKLSGVSGLKATNTKAAEYKISYKGVKGAKGYEYKVGADKKFTIYWSDKVTGKSAVFGWNYMNKEFMNDAYGTSKLYVKVRAYVKSGDKYYYGPYSSVKEVAIKY